MVFFILRIFFWVEFENIFFLENFELFLLDLFIYLVLVVESIGVVYFVVLIVDVWLELSVVLLVFNVRDIVLNVILKIVSRMIVVDKMK